MNVTVVLCTYKRADSLRATLEALGGQRVPIRGQWKSGFSGKGRAHP